MKSDIWALYCINFQRFFLNFETGLEGQDDLTLWISYISGYAEPVLQELHILTLGLLSTRKIELFWALKYA